MTAIVAIAFNTFLQRMQPGANVSADDDLSPYSYGDLVASGRIVEPVSSPASRKVRRSK